MAINQIFVEGIADKKFIQDVITYIHHPERNSIIVNDTGGKDGLKKGTVRDLFKEALIREGRNYIIFDANGNRNAREAEIRKDIKDIDPNCAIFLLPDNNREGNLENLLEELVCDIPNPIFSCFDQYLDCLQQQQRGYIVPDLKTKIYAYVSTLGGEPKEEKRNYLNPAHWNLNARVLDPLKAFLATI